MATKMQYHKSMTQNFGTMTEAWMAQGDEISQVNDWEAKLAAAKGRLAEHPVGEPTRKTALRVTPNVSRLVRFSVGLSLVLAFGGMVLGMLSLPSYIHLLTR
jgi:hypothetical protein